MILKTRLIRYKNVIFFDVLEQNGMIYGCGEVYTASNGVRIISSVSPHITRTDLFIRGTSKKDDELTSCLKCWDVDTAKRAFKQLRKAIKEFGGEVKIKEID